MVSYTITLGLFYFPLNHITIYIGSGMTGVATRVFVYFFYLSNIRIESQKSLMLTAQKM